MRAPRALGILAGVSAVALATLFVAAPASAATLPPGQKITVADGNFVEVGPSAVQLLNANPADASLTAVGAPTGATAINIEVNDDGVGYGTGTVVDAETSQASPVLYTVNANTGVIANPVPIISTVGDLPLTACNGIDLLANGEILLACVTIEEVVYDSVIGVVTPAGAFTPFYDSIENDDPGVAWGALASNPVTGELWVFGNFDGPAVYLVDRAAGTVGDRIGLDLPVYGADFDRSGQLFVTTDEQIEGPFDDSVLATANPAAGDVTPVNTFTVNGANASLVSGITIWGKLAATGSTTGAETLPVALGSALLLLAGAAFIATARIGRRKSL